MRTKWLWLVPLTGLLLILVATVVVVSAGPISDRLSATGPGWAKTPPADNSILLRTTPGGIVPTNDWPDACQLIGERDVLAILPDATEVDSMPGGASTMTIEEYAADPRWREEEGTTRGSCVWDMKLPGEQPDWYTTVWVRIIAVADPTLIGKYHEDQGTYRGAGVQGREYPGGGSCYLSSRGLRTSSARGAR